jgi:hypothetical protein
VCERERERERETNRLTEGKEEEGRRGEERNIFGSRLLVFESSLNDQ